MPQDVQYLEEKQTLTFNCQSCGGQTAFDPATQQLKCTFCEALTPVEHTTDEMIEYDLHQALHQQQQTSRNDEFTRVFHCDNCGAETVLDPYHVADFCSFCGSSHVSERETEEVIQPTLVVPFQITEADAVSHFKQWMKKRYFAPAKLMQFHQMDKMRGIYIPYWTYDADTYSEYKVNVGTHYYVTETYTYTDGDGKTQTGTRMVQKTRWHTERGSYREFFDDVLVQATHQQTKALLAKIEPFRLGGLVDYKDQYVAGFLAERYAVDLHQGWTIAQSAIESAIQNGIVNQVAGDIVEIQRLSIEHHNETFKHVLLPIWLSSFQFKEKTYQFIVNGQTGKISGESPVSWVKVLFTVIGVAAVLGVIYLFMMNQ